MKELFLQMSDDIDANLQKGLSVDNLYRMGRLLARLFATCQWQAVDARKIYHFKNRDGSTKEVKQTAIYTLILSKGKDEANSVTYRYDCNVDRTSNIQPNA